MTITLKDWLTEDEIRGKAIDFDTLRALGFKSEKDLRNQLKNEDQDR